MTTSRENILERLKNAEKGVAAESEKYRDELLGELGKVTPKTAQECIEIFTRELEDADGEVVRVKNAEEAAGKIAEMNSGQIVVTHESACGTIGDLLSKNSKQEVVKLADIPENERKLTVAKIPAALVKAAYGIADIGSVVFLYDETKTTYPHFLAETVFILLSAGDIVANQFELLDTIPEEKTRNMVFVTGPSRTADIEKVLILGAHGPKRVVVFVLS